MNDFKLSPLSLSAILFKLKMLASIPLQKVVTSTGDRFQILKLGLYRGANEACAEDALLENVELVQIRARTHYKKHCHMHSDAVIYIISGSGQLLLGSEIIDYKPSIRVAIPQKVMHGFMTDEETLFLSIQNPHIIDPITGSIDIHYEDC